MNSEWMKAELKLFFTEERRNNADALPTLATYNCETVALCLAGMLAGERGRGGLIDPAAQVNGQGKHCQIRHPGGQHRREMLLFAEEGAYTG